MMRERSAVRLSGTRTVRPWRASAERIAWRIHHTAYEMNFTPWSGSNFRAAVSRPTLPFADEIDERQAAVLVFLGDGDDEAQVALHELLERVLVAGADLPARSISSVPLSSG